MSDERAKAESALTVAKAERDQLETRMSVERERIVSWLDAIVRACERERGFIQDRQTVADAEIAAPYGLFRDSVARLRQFEADAKLLDMTISDLVSDLQDENLWAV